MRKLTAEFIGTYLLALAVVGAGAMATSITNDKALILFINACVAAGILALIITALGPVSGGHFNPAVTLVSILTNEISRKRGATYILAQVSGGLFGVITANAFFGLSIVTTTSQAAPGAIKLFSEMFATAGLVFVIRLLGAVKKSEFIPVGVALWIFTGNFFTPTSAIANPAMTISRAITDSFAGVPSGSVVLFSCVQIAGAIIGMFLTKSVTKNKKK